METEPWTATLEGSWQINSRARRRWQGGTSSMEGFSPLVIYHKAEEYAKCLVGLALNTRIVCKHFLLRLINYYTLIVCIFYPSDIYQEAS